jgi:hypothetical protein
MGGYMMLEGPGGTPVSAKGTADGFFRVVIESGGGGGSSDASAANQLTQIARADTLIASVATLLSETTGLDILAATQEVRDGIVALGNGATIDDLFTQLSNLDSAAAADALVQADIAGDTLLARLATQAIEANTDDIEPQMINGTQRTRVTDGTNNVDVTNSAPSAGALGLVVRQAGPSSVLFAGGVDSQATLATTGKLLKSGAGSALQIQFRNTTGGSIFIQIHDSLTQPSAGARAKWYPTSSTNNNADGSITFGHPVVGVPCQTGVYLVASSTRETYTAIASNSLTYNVVFQ